MRIRASTAWSALVLYSVGYVPIYLAADYFFPGIGPVLQACNLLLLTFVAGRSTLRLNAGVFHAFRLLIVWLVVTLMAKAIDTQSLTYSDFRVIGYVLSSMLSMVIGYVAASRLDDPVRVLRRGAICGFVLSVCSQVTGIMLGVTPMDSTYALSAVGLSNSVALFSAYAAIVTGLGMTLAVSGAKRGLWMLASVVHVGATMRRTAWVVTGAQLLISGKLKVKGLARGAASLLLIALLAYGGWYLLPESLAWQLQDSIYRRTEDLLSGGGAMGSGRTEFYSIAFLAMLDCAPSACLFGIGVDGVVDLMWSQFGSEIGAHSVLLDLGLAFGWPAALLTIALFVLLFRAISLVEKDLRAAYLTCLVAVLVFGALSGVAFEPAVGPAFLAFGLTLGASRSRGRVNE